MIPPTASALLMKNIFPDQSIAALLAAIGSLINSCGFNAVRTIEAAWRCLQ
jgi:hypothetical protein